jgi:carbon starvation protein
MAQIFAGMTSALGAGALTALWYHFAIMFEALFILTTLDAGTRVGRYLLQDALGRLWPRLAGGSWAASTLTSAAFVAAWGYFTLAGVLDPNGGIRALWPLFGIANQLLAATALTIATTLLIRTGRARFAWVTGLPLAFLLAVTMTAGAQYIFHPNPTIGFLARADALQAGRLPVKDAASLGIQVFNARLDAVLAFVFLALVTTVVISAAREWRSILVGRRPLEADPLPGLATAGAVRAFGEVPSSEGGPRCC